ncbi:MAG TPA: L-histidine N(alpha)-methyltransferase [Candidatus Dormibacteraeota bacterium]|jgi:L-histidine N-alpha-methyltransferase|nr:L-histidine N(alpha)-methyltransferase [Candidatus Dormibacteraeota bacterium]
MTLALAPLTVAVHTVGRNAREELVADVRTGLARRPRWLAPRWFYDEEGSRLFDLITELPEYYQTRTERAILRDHAGEIASLTRPESLVELGSGSCSKSRLLIEACRQVGSLRSFVPFDVSDSVVQHTSRELVDEYPGLTVYGMVGDFSHHLAHIPRLGSRLVAFLGSTIGNLEVEQRRGFLDDVRALLEPGDTFLCGFDLVKDHGELIAAYDDSAGVTAAFNRNVLRVINRELDADFDVDAFTHVAVYDQVLDRIEMHLRAESAQRVAIPGAGLSLRFEAGETLRTEISAKFTRAVVERTLRESSMRLAAWFTDPAARFALALASPVPVSRP